MTQKGQEQRAKDEADCLACGACCREAFHAVDVSARSRFARLYPQLTEVKFGQMQIRRVVTEAHAEPPRSRCICLGEDYRCSHYVDRPRTCRDFTIRSENCAIARERVGLPALAAE